MGPPVVAPDEYDLLLNNGRMLEHFHEGNMTNKSAGILSKVSEVFVEISPELATERNVKDGGLVELSITVWKNQSTGTCYRSCNWK